MVCLNVCVSGVPRSGKTLFVTLLALVAVDSGKKVYSNYFIDSPACSLIGIYDLARLLRQGLENPINAPLFNAAVVGSELYGWIESRRSAAKENVLFSYFVFQAGKLGFDIFYDCQLVSTVDVRLRELTQLFLESERVDNGFRYYVLDKSGAMAGDMDRTDRNFLLPDSVAMSFWDKYNSYKVVEPLGYADLLAEMEKFSPELMRQRVDSQVDLLLGHLEFFPRGRVSRVGVEYALQRLGEPDCFSASVAYGLSLRLQEARTIELKRKMGTRQESRWFLRQ